MSKQLLYKFSTINEKIFASIFDPSNFTEIKVFSFQEYSSFFLVDESTY